MSELSYEQVEKIMQSNVFGVRDNTPFGSFMVARNLPRKEAIELIDKLEKEAKQKGTYYEDRFTLTYRV